MAHKRNTKGLAKAAKQRREDTIKRVNATLERLSQEKQKINFNIVAQEANVGKPWLYKEKAIRERIESLRQQTYAIKLQKTSQTSTHTASEKSKVNLIVMLKERVRKLETENKTLKKQMEVLYGQLYRQKQA